LQGLDKQRRVFSVNPVGAEKGNQGSGDLTFGILVKRRKYRYDFGYHQMRYPQADSFFFSAAH
jgi:hypothetical protein